MPPKEPGKKLPPAKPGSPGPGAAPPAKPAVVKPRVSVAPPAEPPAEDETPIEPGPDKEYTTEEQFAHQSILWHAHLIARTLGMDPAQMGDICSDVADELEGTPPG